MRMLCSKIWQPTHTLHRQELHRTGLAAAVATSPLMVDSSSVWRRGPAARGHGKGFVLNSVFGRLEGALKMVESIEGIEFTTSTNMVT